MTPSVQEQEYIGKLRAGDADAFEKLVREHAPRMLAVARRLMRDDAEAQDALQDAFVSVVRHLKDFQGQSALGTWLHSIVVRASLMRLRTKRSRKTVEIDALLPQFSWDGHRKDVTPRWSRSAEELAGDSEVRKLVREAIESLPEIHREVLMLRDIEEMSTQETAAVLEVSEAVVKTRLHRARQALRTLLDPHFSRGSLT